MQPVDHLVYDLPVLASPAINASGSTVVWTSTTVDRSTSRYVSRIWSCDVATGAKRVLTSPVESCTEPVWSPDATYIAYVRSIHGADSHDIVLHYAYTNESRIVTSHAVKPAHLAWSRDGSQIAYVVQVDPDNPSGAPESKSGPAPVRVTRRIDYKQDGSGWLNDIRNQIFVVDVESGTRRQLTSDPIDHVRPSWSPDGMCLATVLPNRNQMLAQTGLLNVESGELRLLGARDGETGLASFSPDGSRLFVAADEHGGPHMSGYVVDVESGAFSKVLDDPEFMLDAASTANASFPVWLDSSAVLAGANLRGRSGLWRIDLDEQSMTQVGIWDAVQTGLSVTADGAYAVQTVNALDGTIGIAHINLANGERRLLTTEAMDVFAAHPVASFEEISVEVDGGTVHAWLLKPRDFDESRQWPLVLDIHGGPHGAYGFGLNNYAQALAANGYLVLLVNPRGSSTYGSAFANAIKQDWGRIDWIDLEAVLDEVVARPYVDANRTGAFGYSYGGFMTSWIAGNTTRFKAIVCGAPVFDFESFFGTSDIGHTFGVEQFGGAPWDIRDHIAERSPSSHIHKAVTPTLIIHGEADERCPIGQGEQMFISLLMQGVETEFVRYPGGYHGVTSTGEPAYRIDYMTRTINWVDRFLKQGA